MTDKYDEAVDLLTRCPGQIEGAWYGWSTHPAGCLFNFIPDTDVCLTGAIFHPASLDGHILAGQILGDKRIPRVRGDITVDNLHVFAEWQRKLDQLYPGRD